MPKTKQKTILSFYPQDPSGLMVVNIPTSAVLDSGGFKIDHRIDERQSLSWRYIVADSFQSTAAFTGTLAPPARYPADMFNSIAPTRAQIAGMSHQWNLRDNQILESRFGMTRCSQIVDTNNKINPADLGIESGPLEVVDFWVPALYYLSDFGSIGGVAGYPVTNRPNQTYDWSEHFTWVRGTHTLKIGGNFQRARTNVVRNRARLDMVGNFQQNVNQQHSI
jgi:hypothetical protein